MNKHTSVAILAVFTITVLGAPSGLAGCIPAKSFTNFNTIETPGAYYYIHWSDATVTSADIEGRFWQTGNRAAANEGTYDDADWLLDSTYYPGTDEWYLNGNLGDARVVGCPVGYLTVFGENLKTANFFVATIDETPPRSVKFDYSRLGIDFNTEPIPRPRVVANHSVPGMYAFDLDLTFDDPSSAVYGSGAEWQIDLYSYTGDADPGRHVDAWTLEQSNVGAGISWRADCTDVPYDHDIYMATGISVDGVAPLVVSESTAVECGRILAQPDKRFKLVQKPEKPGN